VKRNVGIFVFDDVEVLDFAGPFEVFSRVRLDLIVLGGQTLLSFAGAHWAHNEAGLELCRALARFSRPS
jgi:hypothetical protein